MSEFLANVGRRPADAGRGNDQEADSGAQVVLSGTARELQRLGGPMVDVRAAASSREDVIQVLFEMAHRLDEMASLISGKCPELSGLENPPRFIAGQMVARFNDEMGSTFRPSYLRIGHEIVTAADWFERRLVVGGAIPFRRSGFAQSLTAMSGPGDLLNLLRDLAAWFDEVEGLLGVERSSSAAPAAPVRAVVDAAADHRLSAFTGISFDSAAFMQAVAKRLDEAEEATAALGRPISAEARPSMVEQCNRYLAKRGVTVAEFWQDVAWRLDKIGAVLASQRTAAGLPAYQVPQEFSKQLDRCEGRGALNNLLRDAAAALDEVGEARRHLVVIAGGGSRAAKRKR